MNRRRAMELVAFNLTTEPPHSQERYLELFNFIKYMEGNPRARYYGERHVEFEFINYIGEYNYVIGTFLTYVDLDDDTRWYNRPKREPIVDDMGNPVSQTPPGVVAHFKQVPFIFYVDNHILVYDSYKSISPGLLRKGLNTIFSYEEISKKFGPITLSIIPKQKAVEELITLKNKNWVEISLSLPNGDTFSGPEKDLENRLREANVSSMKERYTAQKNKSLKLDETMKTSMRLSARNGYTKVGYTNTKGVASILSTTDMPRIEKDYYIGKRQEANYWEKFKEIAKKFFG